MVQGSRITSEDSEGGRAAHLGNGGTVVRSPHRTRVPDLQGRRPPAHRPEEESALSGDRECGSASHRGARCGKTARRDRCGGRRVTGVPTATPHEKKGNRVDKKTLRERVSRLKGIAQLIEKLPIRFLRLLCRIGAWLVVACMLAAVLTGCASPAPACCSSTTGTGAASSSSPAPGSRSRLPPASALLPLQVVQKLSLVSWF